MSLVVGVHGIGQEFVGRNVLRARWLPALRDGLSYAGVDFPRDDDLVCASYGVLFRPPGGKKGVDLPSYDADDVKDGWERELLEEWWREAAAVEKQVHGPEEQTKLVRAPSFVQDALDALMHSRFFAGIAENVLIFALKQVRSYFHDPAIRRKVQEEVVKVVDPEKSCVMIGHSLGSVAAYEALCAHPEWSVRTLVTLGSPLGIRNLIFDRLQPAPRQGIGAWPGSVNRWINIADRGDIVALVKDLRHRFGPKVENRLVRNGAKVHDVEPYLTAKETGDAIVTGLR